jgi:hypothetical protein
MARECHAAGNVKPDCSTTTGVSAHYLMALTKSGIHMAVHTIPTTTDESTTLLSDDQRSFPRVWLLRKCGCPLRSFFGVPDVTSYRSKGAMLVVPALSVKNSCMDLPFDAARVASSSRTRSGTSRILNCMAMPAFC